MRVFFLALIAFLLGFASVAYADSAAPELFGVKEVILQNARLVDAKASDTCGLSRDQIGKVLADAFAGTTVPLIAVADAKPPSPGVARVDLIPEIHTRSNDNLECASWVGLSAENHLNLIVPPIGTARSVTVLYWRQHALASSGQSTHVRIVMDALKKMATQFAQQYGLDQPPELAK